jgi:hypothetical protein
MTAFSAAVQIFSEGRRPHYAFLVEHDLEGVTSYNWTGVGALRVNGHLYIGKGELAKIGPMPFGADDSAQSLSMTISGVASEWVIAARTGPPVRNSPQRTYVQVFDPDTLQPVDAPYLLQDRFLDTLTYKKTGPDKQEIVALSEDIWTMKNTSERANYSDKDQQGSFPGDRGLQFTAELVSGTRIEWPDFDNSE